MASISKDPNGRKRILFVAPDGTRKTIRLGKYTVKEAQNVQLHVERLLASPRYGEKWGRFWLDLAGYADSEGKRQADMIRPYAYRYRDYVIRAFNDDMPFDTFLQTQVSPLLVGINPALTPGR